MDFNNVSQEQVGFRKNLENLISSIFRSYKSNGFENDRNLNLLRSYILLRNITSKDKDFIKNLVKSRTTIDEQIGDILDKIVT